MARKGKKDNDAELDFFGDSNVDWLSDEEDQTKAPAPTPAPPPPPPDLVSAVPAAARAGETDFPSPQADAKDRKALANAPTLIFSSVPTLPPMPSPLPKAPPPPPPAQPSAGETLSPSPLDPLVADALADPEAEMETVEVTHSGIPDAGDQATGPTEMLDDGGPGELVEGTGRIRLAGRPPPPPTEPPLSEDQPTDHFPSEPTPARVVISGGATPGPSIRLTATPAGVSRTSPAPARARTQTPTPTPTLKGEGGWPAALAVLRAETDAAEQGERAPMCVAGGLMALRSAGQPAEAENWFAEAHAAGARDADFFRLWAEARGALGRWSDQESALLEVAERSEEPDRAEARLEAALVAWRRRQRPDAAVEFLALASSGLPEDYTSRALQRALLPSLGKGQLERRLQILDELAELAEGGVRADALVERATVAEELGRAEEIEGSLRRALEAEPGHTFAFQRLERQLASDPAALAELYRSEATREGQTDPGWWWWRAARAAEPVDPAGAAEDLDKANASLAEAWGWRGALRERAALALRSGDRGALRSSLEADIASDDTCAPWLSFALAWDAERTGEDDRAEALYAATLAADPAATPAADGLARLSRRRGAEDLQPWRDRLAGASDPDEQRALRLRLSELCWSAGDRDEAIALVEQAAASESPGPEQLLAADRLDVLLALSGRTADLAAARRLRAAVTPDPLDRASWLLLAATAPAAPEDALPAVSELLDARPDHPAGIVVAAAACIASGDELALAERLRLAAESALEPVRRASLMSWAARIFADQAGGDPANETLARQLASQASALDPRQRLATWLARSLVGPDGAAQEAEATRAAAASLEPAGRDWALFAASVLDPDLARGRADLEAILADDPEHPGAAAWLEVLLGAAGDRDALLDLRQSVSEGTALDLLRSATDLVAEGRVEEAILLLRRVRSADSAPVRPAARAAVQLGLIDLAIELLAGASAPEDQTERARLLAGAGRHTEAIPLLVELSRTGPDRVGVAARLATVAQQAGETDTMIDAYATLAHDATSASLRAAYSAWTAMQMQAAGRDADALPMWHAALAERPGSTTALAGAVRSLVARRDAEGIRKLFAMMRPESPVLLAEALRFVGDRAGAAEVWARVGDTPGERLASALQAERLREEAAQVASPANAVVAWQAVYDAVCARRELCRTDHGRADADARRRWLLGEKLASTDLAWDMYRAFHEEAPEDRDVTEALARIAAARGETAMAVGFLAQLSDTAPTEEDAARYRRRMGEIHERNGDRQSAHQAYLDALDHLPGDPDALAALQRLAEADGDWHGVVGVLQREASTATGDRQLAIRAQIATITEERLGDPALAVDAWRAVLEIAPTHEEALRRVIRLSADAGRWGTVVEAGASLLPMVAGDERAELLFQLGVACLDHLGREDGASYLEQAVSAETPHLGAAKRLEQHARARADWGGVVRALTIEARADTDAKTAVAALVKAARIQVDALHDKAAAAATWEEVLRREPEYEPALRFMASYLYEAERFAEALPLCERLEPTVERGLDLDDFDARMDLASFFYCFADLLRREDREEEAAARFERTLTYNPAHLPSLKALGPLQMAAGHWSAAENTWRQLVQLVGGHGDKAETAHVYTQLGLVERQLGLQDKAYKRFSKALEVQSNHVGALKGMALVLEDRKDWSNLLNVYNNIIYHATRPEDVIDAYMTKGRVLDDHMQRQDKAAQHYQRSLDFDPNQPLAHLRLAELAMRREDLAEAGELAEKALRLDQDVVQPWRAQLLLVRAAAWQHANRTPEADRCVREARMLSSSLVEKLGASPLADLDGVRRLIKESLDPTPA